MKTMKIDHNYYFPKIEGVKFYLVGGIVRDTILKRKCNDLDYVAVTDKSFNELVQAIRGIGKIFVLKPEYLTIKAKLDNHVVDIVMPRIDGEYKDGRRPENVSGADSLEQDSNRRDFTINALYLDKNGNILDFHDGLKDLKLGIIKTVGDASLRFEEDYLRILRAIRFSIRFGFIIKKNTWKGMQMWAGHLIDTSADRVRDEINKSLKHGTLQTIEFLIDLKLFRIIQKLGLNFELTSRKLTKNIGAIKK